MSTRLAKAVAVVLVIAAAAYVAWGRPVNAIELPTSGHPEGVGNQAAYEGTVLGDVQTGCLTLEDGETVIVWPDGFYALDNPPRVVRPNGDVVVMVGKKASLGGGFTGEAPAHCGTGGRWTVSEVGPSVQ